MFSRPRGRWTWPFCSSHKWAPRQFCFYIFSWFTERSPVIHWLKSHSCTTGVVRFCIQLALLRPWRCALRGPGSSSVTLHMSESSPPCIQPRPSASEQSRRPWQLCVGYPSRHHSAPPAFLRGRRPARCSFPFSSSAKLPLRGRGRARRLISEISCLSSICSSSH